MKAKVVILCGGMRTRLREETEYRPKPLVEIGGKPVLWHIVKIYAHYGLCSAIMLVASSFFALTTLYTFIMRLRMLFGILSVLYCGSRQGKPEVARGRGKDPNLLARSGGGAGDVIAIFNHGLQGCAYKLAATIGAPTPATVRPDVCDILC